MPPDSLRKAALTLRWAPHFALQRMVRRPPSGPCHLIVALADHFEPSITPERPREFAPRDVQEQRLERWCREVPRQLGRWRDTEGFPFRHTYFYPAEQYDEGLVDCLAQHCRDGWGEVEIHLHHGIEQPDTAANTRAQLLEFRDRLARRHGCLSRWDGAGEPRYAFVHGNWALANSAAGRFCGVDSEMQILAETGCYADFTLPSAPSPAQVGKINAIYECGLPLHRRAPHRRGRDLRCGRRPRIFPLIVQGPLALSCRGRRPVIENAEISGGNPATLTRLERWLRAAITVRGRPDWIFLKLHCHGMDPRDESAMFGGRMQQFLDALGAEAARRHHRLHFATAREMANMLLAACEGREGNPAEFRDYRLKTAAHA